ncbi:MAG: hypothetical protein H7256_16390 [Bdellovibrio sp.]|nr:hypothetical protein [Bdellovibrio sp.]
MKLFNFFFIKAKLRHKKKIVKLFALLGYKLNSYHSLSVRVKNILSDRTDEVIEYNQFVPSAMRHPVKNLRVGYWKLSPEFIRSLSIVDNCDFFGDVNKYEFLEFYFPLDLSDEYPGLVSSLGSWHEVIEGTLNPSGRSIWLFPKNSNPLCLKIDTLQLINRQFFSERALLAGGVIHSVAATNYLKSDCFSANEDRGGNIFFNFNYKKEGPKRYTYLLREYDFEKLNILRDDFLIPIVALLSPEFWSNQKLKSSMGIRKSAVDFLSEDFARCFADLIKNSLMNTFLHYEVHQQNLSLHMRRGVGVKLIYHDLQDTVFDTVTYLLHQVSLHGLSQIESHYSYIARFQKNLVLNAHGHLLTHNRATREYFTVVSIYRRYLRNFGGYNKSLNYFLNSDNNTGQYFADKSFESNVLKYLNFTEDVLKVDDVYFKNEQEKQFLQGDLFWSINRFHRLMQKDLLKNFIQAVQSAEVEKKEIDPALFESMLKTSTTLYSSGFPINVAYIDFSLISKMVAVFEDRVLLITYKGEEFLILRFY